MKIRHQNYRQSVVVKITLQWICLRLLGTSRCNYRSQSLSRYVSVNSPSYYFKGEHFGPLPVLKKHLVCRYKERCLSSFCTIL